MASLRQNFLGGTMAAAPGTLAPRVSATSSTEKPMARLRGALQSIVAPGEHPFLTVQAREEEEARTLKRGRDEDEDEHEEDRPPRKRTRAQTSTKENATPRYKVGSDLGSHLISCFTQAHQISVSDDDGSDDGSVYVPPASSPKKVSTSEPIEISDEEEPAPVSPKRLTAAAKGKAKEIPAPTESTIPLAMRTESAGEMESKKPEPAHPAAVKRGKPKKADAAVESAVRSRRRLPSTLTQSLQHPAAVKRGKPKKADAAVESANPTAKRGRPKRADAAVESESDEVAVPKVAKNAVKKGAAEDPAIDNPAFFPTLRQAMKFGGPMPAGSTEYVRLYVDGYAQYTATQKLLQDERKLLLDVDVALAQERHYRAVEQHFAATQAYRLLDVDLRERELALEERKLKIRNVELGFSL
ncbi:hypothetical protein B0H13DRAFT_1993242 [Mycena leptocephala]|nr:hypothetical protein B0H13DRAFT_1993242 [Mycena leptocephala]